MKPTIRRSLSTALVIGVCALLLQACGARTTIRPLVTDVTTDSAQRAEQSGEYVLAASAYEHLAGGVDAPLRQHYQLKSVEMLVKAAQVAEARQKIQRINVSGLEPSFVARKHILEAHILSLEGKADQAIQMLNDAERAKQLSPTVLAEIYRVRAQAELHLGRPINAVKNLIGREQYMVDTKDITKNQEQLWQILQTIARTELKREVNSSRDPVLSGWLDLTITAIEHATPAAKLANAVDSWRKTHVGHPATSDFLKTIASPPPGMIGRIDHIALLLPLTSPHAQAAKAVRDGFLAIHNANSDPDKPSVKIYDIGGTTSNAPIYYAQAIQEGAQMIVGPLGLEAVDQVVKTGNLKVPTLLLSHATNDLDSSVKNIFQFGLPPEQEAAQVAERAYLDGHRQAAVLYPESAWGQRLVAAFTSTWQRLGGIVLTAEPYIPDQGDYSEPVKRLLNVTQSESRKESLEARLRTSLKFEPRPREDINFIFLVADSKHGRLIKPQFNYHGVSRLPVYATSHIFTGQGSAMNDIDLDGVMFGDMPWMLVGDGRIQQLRTSLQRNWPYAHSSLDRLYALGVDAYGIIPHLNRLGSENTVHFNGVTSGLSLERDGKLRRQLLWAKFRKGVPLLLDTFFKYKGQFEIENGTDTEQTYEPGT